ncbi:MAG: DUF4105 domain-containing protein [Ferruginibacter sp.]
MRFFFYFLIFIFPFKGFAQADSSHIRVSLLTCSPGEDLYSTFGHTAIRVTDSISHSDIVYNYGTFDFNDNGFYLKFIRGKLLYCLSAERFNDFRDEYQMDNRSITEQELNLSTSEKSVLVQKLAINMLPQNRYYKYDFFLDNCTTRPRDLIVNLKKSLPPLSSVMPAGTSFREAFHVYLNNSKAWWSKLGIDILLGARCDAVMTTAQQQFLPDNLMKALDSSSPEHQYVISEKQLYDIPAPVISKAIFTPMFVFSLLLILIVVISSLKNNVAGSFIRGFDGVLFFFTGLLGICLVLMWTATDHQMCRNNFNLVWALPSHFVMAFFTNSKKKWVKKYFAFTALLMMALLISWFFLPQQMNNALLPLVVLLLFRATKIFYRKDANPLSNLV